MDSDTPEYVSFERAAGFYDATRHVPHEFLREACRLMVRDGALKAGAPFLDAGVGTGRFARFLAIQGLQVTGIDISSAMLARAREACPGVNLIRGDLRALPVKHEVFEGALIVHILHLVSDWQQVLTEVRGALRPGAKLYLGAETGKRLRTRSLYFQLADERGWNRPHLGAPSFDAVLAHLKQSGAQMSRLDQGQLRWRARARVGEVLATLRCNPFSHLWHVPPEAHAELVAGVEQRLRDAGIALDEFEEAPAELTVWSVDWTSLQRVDNT